MERSKSLPTFFVEGGTKMLGNRAGYWSINAGISIPLFKKTYQARERAARLERDIAQANYETIEMTIRAAKRVTEAQYDKLQRKLVYYRQTALPTAREQQKRSRSSLSVGATDYVGLFRQWEMLCKLSLTIGLLMNNSSKRK